MRKLALHFLRVLGLSLIVVSGAHAQSALQARVIVKLKSNSALIGSSARVAQGAAGSNAMAQPMRLLGQRVGLALVDGRAIAPTMHVALATGMSSENLAASLAKQSDVEFAVVDHWRKPFASSTPPNDPLYPDSTGFTANANPYVAVGQWYLREPNSVTVSAINAPAAWALTAGGVNVVVAVIDTGVRFDHPDLTSKLLTGYNMISDGLRAGNAVGRSPDASDLGDWLTSAEIAANPAVYSGCVADFSNASSSWHGTQVASIIGAAANNNVGMASVAWDTPILPVRVLGKCGGWDSDIAAGMRWAAGLAVPGVSAVPSQTARVLNLSLGGDGACTGTVYPAVVAELAAQNVVVVASAGNTSGQAVSVPANCTGVVAVAGLRHAGSKVGYSSLGPEVTISAPGGNCQSLSGNCLFPILTATNTGATAPAIGASGATYSNSSNDIATGTSFSAPQVSGAVALMLSMRPELTPGAVAQILKNTARPFPSSGGSTGIATCSAPTTSNQLECYCTTTTCGAGMLDVGQAVAAAATGALVPVIAVSPAQPQVGSNITLSASGSMPASVGTLSGATYSWALTNSGGIVSTLTPTADPMVVTALPRGAGSFQVTLTIVDSGHRSATSTQTISVMGANTPIPLVKHNGGGELDGLTLLGLASVVAMAWAARRKGACAS